MKPPAIHSNASSGYELCPALPQALLALVELCRKADVAETNLTGVIATDPALVIQTFKTASTIRPTCRFNPLGIDQAVSILGLKNIRLMSARLFTVHNDRGGQHDDLRLIRFWQHSLLCANIANRLAAHLGMSTPENAYLAGLLHDIGTMTTTPENADGQPQPGHTEKSDQPPDAWATGSRVVFNACGNPYIADAIRYHRAPLEKVQSAFPLVKIVHLANQFTTEIDNGTPLSYPAAETLLNLPAQTVDGVIISARDETNRISRSYGIGAVADTEQASPRPKSPANQAVHGEIELATLLAGVLDQLLRATDARAVVQILQDAIQVEFGLPRPIYLQHLKTRKCLAVLLRQASDDLGYDPELIVNLDKPHGLLVKAFNENRIRHTMESSPAPELCMADLQVRRLLHAREMVCIPVNGRQATMGLLVIGLEGNHMRVHEIHGQKLKMLSDYAGMRLDDLKRPAVTETGVDTAVRSRDLITRKMIHEASNPLGVIKNYLGVLKAKLPESHPVQNEAGIIEEEINRIKTILSQYADLATFDERMDNVDVNALIGDLRVLMETSFNPSSSLQLDTHLDPMLPLLSSNRGKLKQVLLNLLLNAAEAMPDGGQVLIQTQYIPASVIGADASLLNINGKIQILIKDDGPGIPDKIKAQLFQPLNTSKAGSSAGLGLSIVYNLLLELNGTITCDSSKFNGTMFTITLPVYD